MERRTPQQVFLGFRVIVALQIFPSLISGSVLTRHTLVLSVRMSNAMRTVSMCSCGTLAARQIFEIPAGRAVVLSPKPKPRLAHRQSRCAAAARLHPTYDPPFRDVVRPTRLRYSELHPPPPPSAP